MFRNKGQKVISKRNKAHIQPNKSLLSSPDNVDNKVSIIMWIISLFFSSCFIILSTLSDLKSDQKVPLNF